MIPLSLAEVAAATGGRLDGISDPGRAVTGAVVVDSRSAAAGSLFVALAGERADGHDYAAAAVRAGAVAVLAQRPVGAPAVLVADQIGALGRLARAVLDRRRRAGDLRVVGITGSSGKTGTKDLVEALLAPLGDTVAAAGSFNNEIGLPLTVCRLGPGTRFLVLEYSARGPGHIATLCGIAPPDLAVVLNVGTAHLGEFGSRVAIAAAKAELVAALPSTGVAVLNADDPRTLAMRHRTAARVVTFGRAADADVRASDVRLDDRGRPAYTLATAAGSAPVQLAQYGEHLVSNSLAAAAVALELGAAPAEVAAGLAAARPASRWRMEVATTPAGVTVVNDAYNANPDSMRAALRALAAMSAGRRSWAVLGEMAELGPAAAAEHADIGRLVAELGVRRLVVVGAAAGIAAGAAEMGLAATTATTVEAAVRLLQAQLEPGDVVLVKASRAVGLERVAGGLLASPVPA